jgi:hypothetical protein
MRPKFFALNRNDDGSLAVGLTVWQNTSREPEEVLRRIKAAQRLQSGRRLRGRRLGPCSGYRAGFSSFRYSELGRSCDCSAHGDRISDRACSGVGIRADAGRNQAR